MALKPWNHLASQSIHMGHYKTHRSDTISIRSLIILWGNKGLSVISHHVRVNKYYQFLQFKMFQWKQLSAMHLCWIVFAVLLTSKEEDCSLHLIWQQEKSKCSIFNSSIFCKYMYHSRKCDAVFFLTNDNLLGLL